MEMDVRALNALIPVFDFVGIVAFALSGVFEGIKRRIDPVGVFIVAFSTAFGGGMLRDILIDRRPFYWIDHEAYVVATFVICMAAPFIYKFFQRTKHAHDWYIFADAIGLGIFCISGTSLSLAAGVPWLSSVIIGCRPSAVCGCRFYRMLVLHHAFGTQSSGRCRTLGRLHFHYGTSYGLRLF